MKSLSKMFSRNTFIKKNTKSTFSRKMSISGLKYGDFSNLLKKRLWHRCFPVNFAKFLKTPFLKEHPQWLLQSVIKYNICHVDKNMKYE